MRPCLCLCLVLLLTGCMPRQLDRAGLDELYQETALAEGVLTSVPPPIEIDPDAPPIVVNWWYAGTRMGKHYLVYRELTWDKDGEPVGRERRYRVLQEALSVPEPFDKTRDEALWLPLFEAAPGVPEPWGLLTSRQRRESARPEPVGPSELEPEPQAPRPVRPPAAPSDPAWDDPAC